MASIAICWLCGLSFDSKKRLRSHVAAAPHNVLTVVCPWCPVEKTSSRIGDLKRHVSLSHKEMAASLKEGFFSEANGFWLATRPEDYRRVVVPSPQNADMSVLARSFITTWLSAVRGASRSRAAWEKGWGLTTSDPLNIADPPSSGQYVATISPPPLPHSSQVVSVLPAYSPTRPDIGTVPELSLINLEYGTMVATVRSSDGTWYIVSLDEDIKSDARGMEAIKRRLGCSAGQTPEQTPPGVDQKLSGITFDVMRKTIGDCLGIRPAHVKSITMRQVKLSEASVSLPFPFPTFSQSAASPEHSQESQECNETHTVMDINNTETDQGSVMSADLPEGASIPAVAEVDAKQRAHNILVNGAMPLIPPARRNWKGVNIQLKGREDTIVWPPRNWENLDPKQRLAAWELAAFRLDAVGGIPQTPRGNIMDMFNFLALEGTANPVISSDNMAMAKARLANFKLIAGMAKDTPTDHTLLSMFEMAASCRQVDPVVNTIIAHLEASGVKIRI